MRDAGSLQYGNTGPCGVRPAPRDTAPASPLGGCTTVEAHHEHGRVVVCPCVVPEESRGNLRRTTARRHKRFPQAESCPHPIGVQRQDPRRPQIDFHRSDRGKVRPEHAALGEEMLFTVAGPEAQFDVAGAGDHELAGESVDGMASAGPLPEDFRRHQVRDFVGCQAEDALADFVGVLAHERRGASVVVNYNSSEAAAQEVVSAVTSAGPHCSHRMVWVGSARN